MIAGLILLMDRSIKPGDVIAVEGGHGNSIGLEDPADLIADLSSGLAAWSAKL